MYIKVFKTFLLECLAISLLKLHGRSTFGVVFVHSIAIGQSSPGVATHLDNCLHGPSDFSTIRPKFLSDGNTSRNGYTFIAPARGSLLPGRNGTVQMAKEFTFDERAARRARRLETSRENMAKKKKAKMAMKKLVETVKITNEQHKAMRVQQFISDIKNVPKRKRLPEPPEMYSPSYDALLYLKGIPYAAKERDVADWLRNYNILNVVLIKNENGLFTGDAYVRCPNIAERDKIAAEMADKAMGGRYIQVFRVNENAYLEYYHAGHRKEPRHRNHIDPSVLVTTSNQYDQLLNSSGDAEGGLIETVDGKSFMNNVANEVDVNEIKTGTRLVGTVTEVFRRGVVVDCNIFETANGLREKVFCVLKRNRIAKNIGLQGQQHEWLRTKQLVLFPGVKLNLYVEKVRETSARNTFDADMWREHFHGSLLSTYFDATSPAESSASAEPVGSAAAERTRPLVYLTMDSSVSEDKVMWWEKKILGDVAARHKAREAENVVIAEDLDRTSMSERTVDQKVKVRELCAGHAVVHGNQPQRFSFQTEEEAQTAKHESEEASSEAAPDRPAIEDIPIGELLSPGGTATPASTPSTTMFSVIRDGATTTPKSEYLDEDYQKLTRQFFRNTEGHNREIKFHDFEPDPDEEEDPYEDEVFNFEDGSEEPSWMLDDEYRKSLEASPRMTLYDPAISLPPNGLILRESEVAKLTHAQVNRVLELLGKQPGEAHEDNRAALVEAIRNEGVPPNLLPQTLIQKGLFRVKQSKEYMKHIVRITKDLTDRKFSREDLDAATTQELEMLVEEALYKFLSWNPPWDIKKQFISNYHHMLDDSVTLPNISEVVPKPGFMATVEQAAEETEPDDENKRRTEKLWNDMKWLIVTFIYGEQSDLKEITRELNDDIALREVVGAKRAESEPELVPIAAPST